MKTKNNVRKAAIKSIAAATGLMLIGLTVDAQMSSENTGNSPMAMVTEKTMKSAFATPDNSKNLATADAFAVYLANETEETLHLEDWMLNENNFSTMFSFESETEPALEFEDWMTKESNFDANLLNFEVTTEEELNLENWMLNENRFDVNENKTELVETKKENKTISTATFVYTEVNEERALKVEEWMINPKVWGR